MFIDKWVRVTYLFVREVTKLVEQKKTEEKRREKHYRHNKEYVSIWYILL
jgi:hypothetical protein